MENFEPIDIKFLINSDKVAKDTASVKKNIVGVSQSAEDTIDKVNATIAKTFVETDKHLQNQQNKVLQNKRKWDGLGNSINQLSREMPAFSVSAQTGILALSNNIPIFADEIAKLRKENDLLKASGEKTTPVWKQLAKGILSWQTLLSVGISLLTIYGREVGVWIKGLYKGKDALDSVKQTQEALNNAIKGSEYSKAINEVSELTGVIKLAKNGQIEAKVAIDKYNKSLGESAGFVKDLASAEKGLVANSDAYIRMTLYKSAATAALQSSNKEIIENETKKIKLENKLETLREEQRAALALHSSGKVKGTEVIAANKIGLKNKLQDIADVEKEIKKLENSSKNVYDKLLGKAADIANKFNLDLFGGKGKDLKIVDEHTRLMEKLESIDKEYARKSFTKDDEELQALKDKFAKIRTEVEKFNENDKNKGKQISTSGLNTTETKAIKDLTFRQETEKLKTDLAEKKKLYEGYELYKKQFGIDKAKEQYKEQIGEFDSYLEYIKSKVSENQTSVLAVNTGTATGGQKERVNVLSRVKQDATTTEQQQYNELLAGLQNYETERNNIISKYQVIRQKLISDGAFKEAEELDKQHKATLGDLDDNYAKGTDEYKALIIGVENLSIQAAETVIKNAKTMVASLLATGQITEKTANEINKKIGDAEKAVGNKSSDKFNEIARKVSAITSEFGALGDAVSGFDEDLGETISTMGEFSEIALDAAYAATAWSTDPIGAAKAGIKAITGVINYAKAVKESEKQAREEIKQWQDEIFASQLAYNALLRDRLIDEQSLNDLYQSRVDSIKEEYEANKLNTESNKKDQQDVLSNLLSSKTVVGKKTEKYGGFLGIGRKTRTVDVSETVASALGISENSIITDEILEQLDDLNANTPLTDDAKEAYEQLQVLRDEYGSLANAQEQLRIEWQDSVVGNTAQVIGDSIAQGIANGKTSFADFADDIEGFLRDAMIAGMNADVIEPQMQVLQDKLFGYLEDGVLEGDEKEAFDEAYRNVLEQAQEYADAFNQTGIDLTGDSNSTGLTGSISRSLTEETGSELTGLFRGQYDITKGIKILSQENVDISKQSFDILNKHLLVAEQTQVNTAKTVSRLDTLIAKTGSKTGVARDLGL